MQLRPYIFVLLVILASGWQKGWAAKDMDMDSIRVLLQSMPDDTIKVNKLIQLANNNSWSDVKTAEQFARQALQTSQELNYIKGMAYAKYRLSLVFIDSDFKITEELILESLEHAQEIRDSILVGRIYNAIGSLKSNLEENDDALDYYFRALKIFQRHDQDSLASAIYNNLGIIYDNIGNDSLSEAYYLKAADINQQKKNYLWLAINYLNIAYSSLEAGNLDKGRSYLNMSHQIAQEKNFQRLLSYVYNNYSQYYFLKNEYQEAIAYARQAEEMARKHANLLQESQALLNLKKAHFEANDLVSAYNCAERIIVLNDSINRYNKLKEIDLLEMRYEYEKVRRQQQLESELLKAEIQQKELTLFLIIAGAVLVILFFTFLYIIQRNHIRRKNLQQKTTLLEKENLAQQLEFKNKELTTNVMYLLKKNEFISSISQKLKSTNLNQVKSNAEAIEKIVSELDRSISADNWIEFEVRFQEVHVDFYNKLSRQFPDLTPNELRLCAFLKLNMTSKEIAGITYQSMESLKTARYRLRKKLGMDRDENLIAFLAKI